MLRSIPSRGHVTFIERDKRRAREAGAELVPQPYKPAEQLLDTKIRHTWPSLSNRGARVNRPRQAASVIIQDKARLPLDPAKSHYDPTRTSDGVVWLRLSCAPSAR